MTDRHWIVGPEHAGVRLDKFLAAADRLASRGRAAAALERGKVFVDEKEAGPGEASRRLRGGERVRVWEDRPGSRQRRLGRPASDGELAVVFEDDVIVVVNKPPGLLTVPLERRLDAPSVLDALAARLRHRAKRQPLAVHRIDRDTSGLVVFAMRPDAQAHLKAQFRRHEPERIYLAVVHGSPQPVSGIWRDRVVWDQRALLQKRARQDDGRGREARSGYKVVEALQGASVVEFTLVTGRQNQIRLQALLHGHPLVGEERYIGDPADTAPIDFRRQALHAYRLTFRHPTTGRAVSFEAALPGDLRELIASLKRSHESTRRPRTSNRI